MAEHWFWLLLTIATVLWYSTITVYVALKAGADIKNMLARLSASNENERERKDRIE